MRNGMLNAFVALTVGLSCSALSAAEKADLSSPQKALTAFAKAAKARDVGAFRSAASATNEELETYVVTWDMEAAAKALNDAAKKRFGDDQAYLTITGFPYEDAAAAQQDAFGPMLTQVEKAKVDVRGDTADVHLAEHAAGEAAGEAGGQGQGTTFAIPMIRTAEGWKLDLGRWERRMISMVMNMDDPSKGEITAEQMKQLKADAADRLQYVKELTVKQKQFADDIGAGKYATINAVAEAYQRQPTTNPG